MHPQTAHDAHVIFGLNPMWLSGIILVLVYIVLITEKVNRAVIALIGAFLMIYCGLLNQQQAIAKVDFNTLWLLIGMMMLVSITAKTGIFQYVAIRAAKIVRANPVGILIMLTGITAVFSALLDNVTTVLLITPVTLLITEQLRVKAFPYLFATIVASNIGGTATLVGDPPNIIIGSATGLSFDKFIMHMTPISLIILIALCIALWLICRKQLVTTLRHRAQIMRFDEKEAIRDLSLLKKSAFVFLLVLIGFIIGHPLHIEPGTVALSGAALLMLLAYGKEPAEEQGEDIHHTFSEVEWVTIFFFMGLFIIVGAVEHSGLLEVMGDKLISATDGNVEKMAYAVLWVSAILSSVLDNIPFVATMIPLLEAAGQNIEPSQFEAVWWALALGACLGGNGTLIGASANLTVAAFAEKAKQPIGMVQYAKYGFVLMLITIVFAHAYLWLRYF
ncbi:SLC13 family permease [Suttonella ornithocola]|uniref:Arsenic efflux pump protein n=1 Tax=Suttonella ornithocola TaxID=279832 RepID=A0A380MZ87_9GAMM|nr:ArsB/NhaD family transporter [Suttonella ornithocola]SUO97524.1 Arsenic efflux pump protein [Suttonella ornithocola]